MRVARRLVCGSRDRRGRTNPLDDEACESLEKYDCARSQHDQPMARSHVGAPADCQPVRSHGTKPATIPGASTRNTGSPPLLERASFAQCARGVRRHSKRQTALSLADTRLLVLTTFDLDEYVYAALRAGASGSCSRTPVRPSSCKRSGSSPPAKRCSRRR
jgi:hypothetical protein